MSLDGLVISLTILAIATLWIAAPLLLRRSLTQTTNAAQKQRDRLLTNYERVLNNLRDLDEDFATGKLQAEDYTPEREQFLQRGIRLLMELDKLAVMAAQGDQSSGIPGDPGDKLDKSIDQSIEEAVATYRRNAGATR